MMLRLSLLSSRRLQGQFVANKGLTFNFTLQAKDSSRASDCIKHLGCLTNGNCF